MTAQQCFRRILVDLEGEFRSSRAAFNLAEFCCDVQRLFIFYPLRREAYLMSVTYLHIDRPA